MTIKYLDSKRISGLSTDTPTETTSNITWSTTGKVGYNISGTTISRTGSAGWSLSKIQSEDTFTVGEGTFRIEFSGNGASVNTTQLGFNKGTLGYHYGSGSPQNPCKFAIYMAGGDQLEAFVNGTKVYGSGGTRSASDKYRLEINNDGLVKYYLQAGGTGSWVKKHEVTGASGTYFIQANSHSASSEATVHSKTVTTIVKPTNVQDNSILVEKDTGRRYWFDLGVEPKGTSGSGGDWAETSFNNSTIVNNESASGNVVTRTSGSGWNSYIRSNEYISPSTGGGEIYFTQSANTNISVGLEKSPFNPAPSATYTGKDYSFHTTSSSNNMYEHTSDYAGTAWASATNEYRITMDSAGLVKYYWRSGSSGAWTLERTSTVTASGDYYFTVSHSGTAGAITSYIKGTPATWTRGYFVYVPILATRGVIGGGHNSGNTNVMDYITIATTGNATDFGDLTQARYGIASVYSDTRGCFAGGYSGSYHTIIDYITTLTTGNATDFGDLSTGTYSIAGVSNLTRGVVNNSGTGRGVNMEYITINTLGDATTFGNLTVSATSMAGNVNSETRGIFSGGNRTSSVFSNIIEYITIDTTGNATDFGDLTLGRYSPSGLSSETRGLIYGGLQTGSSVVNTIDYVTIATTGNATDFGDLCGDAVEVAGGLTNDTRGCMAGLNSSSNTICYSTIATTGNASDFGDLTVARSGGGGVSG